MWRNEGPDGQDQAYRLCANYDRENVCNWGIPIDDPQTLCRSCRLTHIIPDLSNAGNTVAWYRLEVAKRRLVYTLLGMRLPLERRKTPGDGGVEFHFLEDSLTGDGKRVLTGHDNGLITINIAEADDVRREEQRLRQERAVPDATRPFPARDRTPVTGTGSFRTARGWRPSGERFGDERA